MRDDPTFPLPADPEFRARAAALRREWQADEEEWSRAALEHFRHHRSLVDVLRDAMHRGDVVVLGAEVASVRGVVVHMGDDWCRVDTVAGAVEVPVGEAAPMVRFAERSRHGGCSGDPAAPARWRARLLEFEVGGDPVLVHVATGEALRGRVLMGGDHLAVIDGDHETYVPAGTVVGIRRLVG